MVLSGENWYPFWYPDRLLLFGYINGNRTHENAKEFKGRSARFRQWSLSSGTGPESALVPEDYGLGSTYEGKYRALASPVYSSRQRTSGGDIAECKVWRTIKGALAAKSKGAKAQRYLAGGYRKSAESEGVDK